MKWIIGGAVLAAAGLAPAHGQTASVGPQAAEECSAPDGDILVCGSRSPDGTYRLPPQEEGYDPWGDKESVSSERHRLLGPTFGGIGSCSTSGPGGWTGCDIQAIKNAERQGKRVGIGSGGVSVGVQVGRKYLGTNFP